MDEPDVAEVVGGLIWHLGADGALGAIVEQMFVGGRAHQALDLLRALAEPTSRDKLRALAQARLDACHEGRGPTVPWAAATLVEGEGVPPPVIGRDATALVEEVVSRARSQVACVREGVSAVLIEVAGANDRPDLADKARELSDLSPGTPLRPSKAAPTGSASDPSPVGALALHAVIRTGPTRPANPVDVALAFDRKAAPITQVAMASIAQQTRDVVFHLAVRGITPSEVERLAGLLDVPIAAYNLDGIFHGGARSLAHIGSPSSLDRMVLPWLLGDLDRVVYVDCDVVAVASLAPLARRDIGTASLAARPIRHGASSIGAMIDGRHRGLPAHAAQTLDAWVRDMGISADAPLFNAGVLVMDLAALRRDERLPAVREVMSLCALDDQDGLCLLAGGHFDPLERRWNHLVAMDHVEDPAILHWAGAHKPWTHLGTPSSARWWSEAAFQADEGRLVWPIPGIGTTEGMVVGP